MSVPVSFSVVMIGLPAALVALAVLLAVRGAGLTRD